MTHFVKITDKEHDLYDQVLPGDIIYYDIHHTGDGPDLFQVDHDGSNRRLLSTQIDEEHYTAQLLADEMARIGVKVGDTVMITKTGSGAYCRGWDVRKPHKITNISPNGQVEFDGGGRAGASMFRPEVRLAS